MTSILLVQSMIRDRIFRSLKTQLPRQLPKGPTGKAIGYTLPRRENICRYLTHGECRIDNYGVENAIHPTAIGKKTTSSLAASPRTNRTR